jgi:hypothetical protein
MREAFVCCRPVDRFLQEGFDADVVEEGLSLSDRTGARQLRNLEADSDLVLRKVQFGVIAGQLFVDDIVLLLQRQEILNDVLVGGEGRPTRKSAAVLAVAFAALELVGLLYGLLDIL